LTTVLVPSSPAAAKAFCLGRKATIVAQSNFTKGTKKADVIVGTSGDETILGGGGNDRICGGAGVDALFGQGGVDIIAGEEDGDQLSGGAGNDVLDGGTDAAGLSGDYVNYFPSKAAVTVNLSSGTATGEGTDKLKRIENVFGSNFADLIGGSDATNLIQPLGGNDVVHSGAGLDIIFDGTGGETPAVDGDDQLDGGDGPDAVHYGSSPAAMTVHLGNGTATGDGTDQLTGLEGAFGSNFDDSLTGDGARNLLLGGLGNDRLDGGPANDAIGFWFSSLPINADLGTGTATGEGNDTLVNAEGLLGSVLNDDTLRGNESNNLLDGDGGNDKLFGLGGDDWITGGAGNDTIDGGAGTYDIADYSTTAFQEVTAAVDVDLLAGTASGQGNDTIAGIEAVFGSAENDFLAGDGGSNTFFGGPGDDQIGAAEGDDRIDAGLGVDDVDGGDGVDKCRNAETAFSCENQDANEVPAHPVQKDAEDISQYRRNF
jgi:Ca2+-binding RTX toxin-like protein